MYHVRAAHGARDLGLARLCADERVRAIERSHLRCLIARGRQRRERCELVAVEGRITDRERHLATAVPLPLCRLALDDEDARARREYGHAIFDEVAARRGRDEGREGKVVESLVGDDAEQSVGVERRFQRAYENRVKLLRRGRRSLAAVLGLNALEVV